MCLPKRALLKMILLFTVLGFALSACDDEEEPFVWTPGCNVDNLIYAIDDANTKSTPVVINLDADCEYVLTKADNVQNVGTDIASGLPVISNNIRINGNNAVITFQRELGEPPIGAFFVGPEGYLQLYDLTIELGWRAHGGAIYINRGRVLTKNTIFDSNVAIGYSGDSTQGRGGAIYNYGGRLTVLSSEFTSNSAEYGSSGGAIYNLDGHLMVSNSEFFENSSINGGGAISIYRGGLQGGYEGVTISNSRFNQNTNGVAGAIYAYGEDTLFIIAGSDFIENSSAGAAGAISARSSNLTIGHSTFRGNYSENCGAIENRNGSELTVSGSLFEQNQGVLMGGGICNLEGVLDIKSSEFRNNQAEYGGGIFTWDTVKIKDSVFALNSADKGGGLYANWFSFNNPLPGSEVDFIDVDVTDSTFSGNQATIWGGGISIYGLLTVNRSTFIDNSADVGGAFYTSSGDHQGQLNVTNSTISQNQARSGAGIANVGDNNAFITHSTFAFNQGSESGGGILHSSGEMTITNSILANNGPEDCWIGIGAAQFIPSGENLDTDGSCTGFSLVNYNPQLDSLADNGGPTMTHALPANSIAVDRTANCAGLSADQRGSPRPIGGSCDLGAYEYAGQPMMLQIPPPTPSLEPFGTIPELVLCWVGPGDPYDVVSSLQPGTQVELLGTGEGGGYLVVTNPKYNLPCWVKEGDVDTGGFDVFSLRVFKIPPLPTPTPTPQLGCWVPLASGAGNKCEVPCPDPIKYPKTCTP